MKINDVDGDIAAIVADLEEAENSIQEGLRLIQQSMRALCMIKDHPYLKTVVDRFKSLNYEQETHTLMVWVECE